MATNAVGPQAGSARSVPLDVSFGHRAWAHGVLVVRQTQGEHAYSVAQHSLLVEDIFCQISPSCSPSDRMAALLHDAPEYVIGDMISPFKAVVGGGYKEVELRLQRAIHLRFSLSADLPERLKKTIKRADHIAAWFEATTLARFTEAEAASSVARAGSRDRLPLDPARLRGAGCFLTVLPDRQAATQSASSGTTMKAQR